MDEVRNDTIYFKYVIFQKNKNRKSIMRLKENFVRVGDPRYGAIIFHVIFVLLIMNFLPAPILNQAAASSEALFLPAQNITIYSRELERAYSLNWATGVGEYCRGNKEAGVTASVTDEDYDIFTAVLDYYRAGELQSSYLEVYDKVQNICVDDHWVPIKPDFQNSEKRKNLPFAQAAASAINTYKKDKAADHYCDNDPNVYCYGHVTLSTAVISLDGSRAYVKFNFLCGGLCGFWDEVTLAKIDGRWKVVRAITDSIA